MDDLQPAAREAWQNPREEAIDAARAVSERRASVAFWTFIAGLLALIAAGGGGKGDQVEPPVRQRCGPVPQARARRSEAATARADARRARRWGLGARRR